MRDAAEIAQLVGAGVVPCLAYLAVGLRLLPKLGLEVRGAERLALAWALGTGSASLAILLLRTLGIPLPVLVMAALAAMLLPFRSFSRQPAAAPAPAAPSGPGWVRGVDAASGALAALTVLAALGPETAWDGFEYHLPLIAAWTEGPLGAVPGMIDAELRAGVDLLYVPAVTSGMPDAAAVVSAGFALALAALLRAEATRRASAGAGALLGFFTLLAPLVVENASNTYVDLGVGVYGWLALLFADRWNRGGPRRDLELAAVFLGFALNAKLHTALLAPALLAVVGLGGRRPSLALLARSAVIASLVAAPWFVKQALTTGNPFFPLLGAWLGSAPADPHYFELRRLRALANYTAARNPAGLLQYLVSLTFGRNAHVSGLLGALPLALAPLALARPTRPTLVLAATLGLLVVLQFFTLPAARFGTPVWPWLALAAAVGGARLAASGTPARVALVGVLALLAVHHVVALGAAYLPRAAALRDPRAHERAVFPEQDRLRSMVARAQPLVGIPMGAVSWMPQPVYNLHWERNGELYFLAAGDPARRIVSATPPERAFELLRERGVRSLVLDVAPPHPTDGRSGHPSVDAWLASGRAALSPDVEPLPAGGERRWVLIHLIGD